MLPLFQLLISRPLKKSVAQVSKPAVSPTSKSARFGNGRKPADLEIHDTADLEVGAKAIEFFRGLISIAAIGPGQITLMCKLQ